ncbi:MAG: metallophosphoesterase [Candidatus Gracilibacteria bacterium]
MKEYIYSISDIEMGRGDITDDFSDDQAVAEFLEKIITDHAAEQPSPKITLVLNGDIFDFLKMEYKGELPYLITEDISLWKLEEVFKTHPGVFKAMKKFLDAHSHTNIHFVIGNHDSDIAWPSLQERIKQELGNQDRVTFDYWYKNGQFTPNMDICGFRFHASNPSTNHHP